MRKKKNGFFAPNQGGLKKSAKSAQGTAFAGLPADIRPLWEIDDSTEPKELKSNIEPEKIPDFSKGGRGLW